MSWKKFFELDHVAEELSHIKNMLRGEYSQYNVYPPKDQIFRALKLCLDINNLKVVIIGQDPYHGPGQANGLAFSVNRGVKFPPSLQNICRELVSDLGVWPPEHGDLSLWAKQGVLLLNTSLTVREGCPGSHKDIWSKFTTSLIHYISNNCNNLVFMLWGKHAQSFESDIRLNSSCEHYILVSTHPSPLSAHRGFIGCKHFSKCNKYLESIGKKIIDWSLND